MSNHRLYMIYDSKVGRFGSIFKADNNSAARRMVIQGLEQDSQLTRFPDDFSLHCVGEIDTETGEIIDAEEFVCSIRELGPPEMFPFAAAPPRGEQQKDIED